MNSLLLACYHGMPASLRSAAATIRGWYLRRWRYNRGSDQLATEALERDRWTGAQWHKWREERIAYVLQRAATRVPYYREQWAARRRGGDTASPELLANWPLLEKDTVRANPRAFLADDCDPKQMFHEQTSGTTGKPLGIWRTKDTVSSIQAIADARTRMWDGIPRDARWARLGGQLVIPIKQRRPPFWVWNAAMRQLYLSSFHLAPDLIPHYLDALARYRVLYIAAYPSSLYALAREALRLGRTDITMTAVYTNAEPVLPEHRATIAEAFQCQVRETYGMTETVAAASECDAGRLHAWPEFGHVEVREDGEFICTGLLNLEMPLIRYRVGDHGSPAPASADDGTSGCDCGRGLPLMGSIGGRTNDLLLTPDGRQVFWLNPVFYGLQGVRQSQIVQEKIDLLRVLIAPAPGFTPAIARTIVERLRQRMGEVRVLVDQVEEVPRTSNGKLRAVICNLSPAQRAEALERRVAVTTGAES
ncbi:MAG TPA: AMP-binding protein [Gemmatimonadales bacterium]|nr:AMP-binding protein [Gemmatimonadales bacterium]